MGTEKIIELLSAGKKAAAKKELAAFLEKIKISPEEEAKVYLELSSLFMKVNSDVMREYSALLDEAAEEFRDLNLKEKILTPKQ